MPLLDAVFTATSNPTAGSQATATHAAVAAVTGQPAKAHICQTIHCTLVAGTTNAAAQTGSIVLRDGATGVGAIIWSSGMGVVASGGTSSPPVEVSGLTIQGTAGNAMTLEFTGGLALCLETVSFTGFLV